MAKVTEALKKKILEDVKQEFPGDEMMQEIHYIRQIHYYETKDLSSEEQIRYFSRKKTA